jgi:hypothetical protein
LRIIGGLRHRLGQLLVRARANRVAHVRAVDRDAGDAALRFVQNVLEWHLRLPASFRPDSTRRIRFQTDISDSNADNQINSALGE